MTRVAAFTLVLVFAGAPAWAAACLMWCCSPCPAAMSRHEATIDGPQWRCDQDAAAVAVLREHERREKPAESAAWPAAARVLSLEPSARAVTLVSGYVHAPPGHRLPPLVLRI